VPALVLTVWAAWCVNRPRETPLFAALQEDAGQRLGLFGIHDKAGREQGPAAAADVGVTFPSVQDADGDRATTQLRVPGPPTTLFVSADGRLVYRHIGEFRTGQELRAPVREHLGVRA
jgi:thiol-disulfide isomerase/thioredoxin